MVNAQIGSQYDIAPDCISGWNVRILADAGNPQVSHILNAADPRVVTDDGDFV
jgi:hypothetical protein